MKRVKLFYRNTPENQGDYGKSFYDAVQEVDDIIITYSNGYRSDNELSLRDYFNKKLDGVFREDLDVSQLIWTKGSNLKVEGLYMCFGNSVHDQLSVELGTDDMGDVELKLSINNELRLKINYNENVINKIIVRPIGKEVLVYGES